MDSQRDSKSFAVKIFFGDGHHEQIKFSTEEAMNAFAMQLEHEVKMSMGPVSVATVGSADRTSPELVTLVLEDNTNIRIDPRRVYFFKSFKMARPRGNRGEQSNWEA